MGKYMKKARGPLAVMELVAQGQLGVRTRARTQAMEKKELKKSSKSTTATEEQISYLELRSRRLEKNYGSGCGGCHKGNKVPPPPPAAAAASVVSADVGKSVSNEECRRLSDLTNSDMLADDCSSRLADEAAQNSKIAARHRPMCDENTEFSFRMSCFGETNAEDNNDSLHCSISRSLQQIRNGCNNVSRGRPPPGAALSRNNSRSNSVGRELPLSTHCNQLQSSQRILTRNRKKLEKDIAAGNYDMNDIVPTDVDIEIGVLCSNRHASVALSNCGTKNEVEVSFGENRIDETLSEKQRVKCHSTALSTAAREEHKHPTSVLQIHSPLDFEIEDFFLQAEQQEQKRFMERYNFDPIKETPLPGRYEWFKLGT